MQIEQMQIKIMFSFLPVIDRNSRWRKQEMVRRERKGDHNDASQT